MTIAGAIKRTGGKIVAVLASHADVETATRMRRLPDLFELRLDAVYRDLGRIEQLLPRLSAPLIITARHPAEGGLNRLAVTSRRALLERFLDHSAWLDVELRSAAHLRSVLADTAARNIKRIISVHDLQRSSTRERLDRWADDAESLAPDVFKIVARTETAEDFRTLVEFFERMQDRMTVSAMGVGKLGRASRIYFATHGSALNYVHLGKTPLEGQLSLRQMRECTSRLLQKNKHR